MSKTIVFWYAIAVTLAVIDRSSGSTYDSIHHKTPQWQPQKRSTVYAEPKILDAVNTATPDVPNTPTENTAGVDVPNTPTENTATPDVPNTPTENTATPDMPNASTENTKNDNSDEKVSGMTPITADPVGDDDETDQPNKPQIIGVVQNIKLKPFIDFFQPFEGFQSFQPFQPFQPFLAATANQNYAPQQPFRYQPQPPQPFDMPVNPFDPFANPMRTPTFNQLVTAYTNEFRNMLEALDKSIIEVDNAGKTQNAHVGSDGKPVAKTTTKTEVINGQVVQTNETTYTDGNDNFKSYFHIKQIQVVPEDKTQKISNEKVITTSNYDSEAEKMETNEIKSDPSDTIAIANAVANDNQNFIKKNSGPVPLEDHFQASATTYYAPYAPYNHRSPPAALTYYGRPPPAILTYYGRPPPAALSYYEAPLPMAISHGQPSMAANYGRPPTPLQMETNYGRPPPISLHGDTLVNELMAAQQQASGGNAVLPPDVEIVDVHDKSQLASQSYNAGHKNYHGKNIKL